jgi:hypothetical protein
VRLCAGRGEPAHVDLPRKRTLADRRKRDRAPTE